jgi:ligand-binding sensor domain-containing protein
MLKRNYILFLVALIGVTQQLFAQQQAIGSWKSHLPYRSAVGIATDGNIIFVAGSSSFYTYNILDEEIHTYSKSNGMSDLELSQIGYDALNQTAILTYQNGNIDLFKNGEFQNIPDLKLKSGITNKTVYDLKIHEQVAYLSTGAGVIAINIPKKETKSTFTFSKNGEGAITYSTCFLNNEIFVASSAGLYKSKLNNPAIQSNSSWDIIDTSRSYINCITTTNGNVLAATADSLFIINTTGPEYLLSRPGYLFRKLDVHENSFSIILYSSGSTQVGKVFLCGNDLSITDSLQMSYPVQVIQTNDQNYWFADIYDGLKSRTKNIIPNGPFSVGAYDIFANNNNVYIAHGSYTDKWDIVYNRSGVSTYINGQWKNYNTYNFPPFSQLTDACRIAIDPQDQSLYIASQTDGLFYLKQDETAGQIRDEVFELFLGDPSTCRISGVAFDQYQNLWVTQTNANNELMARSKKDGLWYKFPLTNTRPRPYFMNGAASVMVDDYNQKWFFSPQGGGVLVYNDNNTLENINDDKYIRLTYGKGSGNLPDNIVQCITNDKKGTIWIGTLNGIGIINCPSAVVNRTCEAEIRIVKYDEFAGELFSGENVMTIAVDGANRKWIGTSNGVWLISEDASKIIHRFTVDNSPLPSNYIQTIKVDPVTGDVYFGTDKGLVSYRSTAIDGKKDFQNVVVYPNPITSDYGGTIAIKGLANNADVKITDISGQLVFKTKSLGGQAVWDGKDYTGHKPESGVYLIFSSSTTGEEKFVGKMVMIK